MEGQPIFQREWADHHGNAPPLAYMLRTDPHKPWLRFHSLDASKRYAEQKSEQIEILRRGNLLASEVLGSNCDCWLVQCRIEEFSKPYWDSLGVEATKGLRYADPEEGFHWTAAVVAVTWVHGSFDGLLESIAQDRTGPTLWMSRESGALFAPYDGGIDLFPSANAEVARLTQIYGDWLSRDPSGL